MTNPRWVKRGFLLVIALALAAAALASNASAGSIVAQRFDDAEECLEAIPAEVSLPSVTDDGHEVLLQVHVLLDGVPLWHGQGAMNAGARPYAEINVKLEPRFEEVSFPAAGTNAEGIPTLDTDEAFRLAREHMRGYRPHGVDVVYVMTSKDLVSSGAIGGSVAGQADCIGGVRYPNRAFAIGETTPSDPQRDFWYGSIVAGHEIGHLLGAHHHYANCAQGDPADVVEYWTSCTLMFNTVTFISRRFSTVEAATVRGHALAYADATPSGPPEIVERGLTLKMSKTQAKGDITSDVDACLSEVAVSVERKNKDAWVWIADTISDPAGFYTAELRVRPGLYRAVTPETVVHDGSQWRTCALAISSEIKVKK